MQSGRFFDSSIDPYFVSQVQQPNPAADFHLLTTRFSPYSERLPHVERRKRDVCLRFLGVDPEEPTSVSLQLNNMWRSKLRRLVLPDQVSKVRKLELEVLLCQSQDLAVMNLMLKQGMWNHPPAAL